MNSNDETLEDKLSSTIGEKEAMLDERTLNSLKALIVGSLSLILFLSGFALWTYFCYPGYYP